MQYMVVYQFILGEINSTAFFEDGSSITNLQVIPFSNLADKVQLAR